MRVKKTRSCPALEVVASVMHETLVGLDITKTLVLPVAPQSLAGDEHHERAKIYSRRTEAQKEVATFRCSTSFADPRESTVGNNTPINLNDDIRSGGTFRKAYCTFIFSLRFKSGII